MKKIKKQFREKTVKGCRQLWLLIGLMVIGLAAEAQTINGTVISTESGETLIGATVINKRSQQGTVTDFDGGFTLSDVGSSDTLIVSYIGYLTREVPVNARKVIEVGLEISSETLDEVVVVGYGTVKKSDLTGSVGVIKGGDIEKRQTTQLSQALQGSIAGLMVTRNSGAADASATIRIRGITTINNSSPLVIIDGIPGDLDNVNPRDVASISVLKDAASASIYGSRAASGVILVTTKRAKQGQLSIDYNFEFGIDKPTRIPEYANAQRYMEMYNERIWNNNNNSPNSEFNTFSMDLIQNYDVLHQQNPDLYPNTNWTEVMLNDNAPRESHVLSLNAGSDKIRTKISLAYENRGALFDNKKYDRITARINNDIKINDKFSSSLNVFYLRSNNKGPIRDFSLSRLSASAPIYANVWTDGRIAEGKTGANDYALLHEGGFNNRLSNQLGGKFSLDFQILENFSVTAVFAPELGFSNQKLLQKQISYTPWDNPNVFGGFIENATSNYLFESRSENYKLTSQLITNYSKEIGGNKISLMAGYENYYAYYESLNASSDQLELNSFPYLDLKNTNFLNTGGNGYENAYRSVFGRILYSYNDRYLLQVNTRYDGSSRFSSENRWGVFPSISAGWIVSEEAFATDFLNGSYLKIRGSIGSLGNDRIGNYPYQSTIGFENALYKRGSGEIVSALSANISKYAIRNISWEKTVTYDLGFDAYFFKDRLRFTGDYYHKITSDMLLAIEIPNYIGFSNPEQNAGEMETKGWEFDLGWSDYVEDFSYSISFNLSDFKSVMNNLGGTQFLGNQIKIEGSQFNEWYGYVSQGLFQSEEDVANSPKLNNSVGVGDVKYLDISGPEGVPDGNISSEYDRVPLGGSLPRYLYGGNVQLNYKNFDLGLSFQGIGQQKAMITTSMVNPFIGDWYQVPKIIDGNYWSVYNSNDENSNALYPRLSSVSSGNNYSFSDYWLFNGSYFRLKNLGVGYSVPDVLIEKLKLQSARVYINSSDLFSIDQYPKGWDPEATSYFVTSTYVLGVSIKF